MVPYSKFASLISDRCILDDSSFETESIKLKLKKMWSLSQVESFLESSLGLSEINIVIKRTLRSGMIRPEVINQKKENISEKDSFNTFDMNSKEKTLNSLCITSQHLLFIDENSNASSKWAEYFKKENNMIVINFNYPLKEEEVVEQVNYNQRIKVDLRKTLADVKKMIKIQIEQSLPKISQNGNSITQVSKIESIKTCNGDLKLPTLIPENQEENNTCKNNPSKNTSETNLKTKYSEEKQIDFVKPAKPHPESNHMEILYEALLKKHAKKTSTQAKDFIMKKGGKSGVEMKDLNKSLRTAGFINNSFLFLRFGRVSYPGEIRINLFYCFNKTSKYKFDVRREIKQFGETHIHSNWKASQTVEHLKKEYPVLKNKSFLLREKNMGVLTKVFRNYSLKTQYVFDRKNIVLEESSLKVPHKDEVFIYYTIMHDDGKGKILDLVYEPVRSLIVNKQNNLQEIGILILEDLANQLTSNCSSAKQSPILLNNSNLNTKLNEKKLQSALEIINLDDKNIIQTIEREEHVKQPESSCNLGKSSECSYPFNESKLREIISCGVSEFSCTKIRDVPNFQKEDVLGHKFFLLNRNDQVVSGSPFYLENDGSLFVLKKKGVSFGQDLKDSIRKQGKIVRNENFFKVQGTEKALEIFVKQRS